VPLVSVLLPFHQAGTTLREAAESILTQTLVDLELLLLDDGSTDDGPAVARHLALVDPRVRTFGFPHRGLVATLNDGRASARGDLIARMDADDLSDPCRLERQVTALETEPDLGLVACRVRHGGDAAVSRGFQAFVDWQNQLLDPEEIALNRFVETPVAHPSVMFRREVANRYGDYRDGPFPEDYELWLRWLEAGVRMRKLPEPLLVWNDPPHRLTRTDPRYAPEAFYACKAAYLARWLATHNPHHPEIVLRGAGRVTRRRFDALADHGVRIRAYVDIDPRKIGGSPGGHPVWTPDQLPPPGQVFVVSGVGSRGARDTIGADLERRGYRLGRHWIPAA